VDPLWQQVTIFTGDFHALFAKKKKKKKKSYLMPSAETKVIPAHGKALINTQISIAVPAGTYGRVAPRSGLGSYIRHRAASTILT